MKPHFYKHVGIIKLSKLKYRHILKIVQSVYMEGGELQGNFDMARMNRSIFLILDFVFRIGGSTIRMLLVVATLVFRFNSIYWNKRIMRDI